MWLNAIILAWPVIYFSWQIATRREKVAYAIAGFYAYPLLAVTAMANDGAIPGASIATSTATIVRGGLHPAMLFAFCGYLLLTSNRLTVTPALLTACSALSLMLFSVLWNHSSADAGARLVLSIIMVINTLLFIPSLAKRDRAAFIGAAARSALFLGLYFGLLSIYAIGRYGPWPPWSPRLGRPLNANLLAYLLSIALCASYLRRTSEWTRVVLLLLILLTASRLNIATAFMTYTGASLFLARSRSRIVLRTALFVGLGAAATVGYVNEIERFDTILSPFSRSDLTSGRASLWLESLQNIQRHPVLGIGDRALLESGSSFEGDATRVHNMVLETAMSYGLPTAIAAFAVYFVLAALGLQGTAGTDTASRGYRVGLLALVGIVLLNATFATAAWTNLADGTAVLLFLLLASLALCGCKPSSETVHIFPHLKSLPGVS